VPSPGGRGRGWRVVVAWPGRIRGTAAPPAVPFPDRGSIGGQGNVKMRTARCSTRTLARRPFAPGAFLGNPPGLHDGLFQPAFEPSLAPRRPHLLVLPELRVASAPRLAAPRASPRAVGKTGELFLDVLPAGLTMGQTLSAWRGRRSGRRDPLDP